MKQTDIRIRPYRDEDLAILKRITVEAFDGLALDQMVDDTIGPLPGPDWRERKARHIDEDVAAHREGVFVAESQGRILGYITTVLDHEVGKGRIPNLAIVPEMRGRGLGRYLIEHALDYFRREGMTFVMIETMAINPVGNHLYPSCGFREVGRQVHFAMKL